MWIILLSILVAVIQLGNGNESEEELIYVQAIWRHGDRAPTKLPYPNDEHDEIAWPRGWGQITNVCLFYVSPVFLFAVILVLQIGMMQMYELGQFFRKRYASFITNFNAKDVNMVSSKSNRAVVSGLAMLRGFFPAVGQEVWLPDELWQPLPLQIATTDAVKFTNGIDMFTKYHFPSCVVVKVLTSQMLKPTSFDCQAYDAESEKENEISHNMTQPPWVYQTWPQFDSETTINIISNLKRIRRISEFNSPAKAQLRGGLLMEDWISRAKNISMGLPITPRKMKLYSAHDGTILALLYALDVANDLLVPYAACVIMEIYKTANNHTIIKFLYKNGTTLHQLPLPGCPSDDNCTITHVEKAVAAKGVRDLAQLTKVDFSDVSR
uniref:BURP domain-containing protein n=1 Tax=Setaria digitata TaxID=48799 RepID=A0A915Q1J6_9BILA